MKTKVAKRLVQAGNTLLITLVICVILGLSTMGYLMLIEQQTRLSTRSQSWNLAMTVVESGIEEGLAHLNENYLVGLASQGWTLDGANKYVITRTVPAGSYSVELYTTNGLQYPVIVATANVKLAELLTTYASAGVITDPNATVRRSVRIKAYKNIPFMNAIASDGSVQMNGNNVTVDSFSSCDPSKSVNGKYDPSVRSDKGNVASNGDFINVGNANIYGKVSTGPGGTTSVGNNGTVGSKEWVDGGNSGIEPGWGDDNSNFTFPSTVFPFTSGPAPAGGTVVLAVSNTDSTNYTSQTFPNPAPAIVVTNTQWITSTTPTNPPPPGYTTNCNNSTTTSTLPSPVPNPPISTNTVWTTTSGPVYPTAGTYVGAVVTNWQNANKIKNYSYNRITGYTYNYCTYSYPLYSYTWTEYSTNVVYETNTYTHILYSGDYYASSLSGDVLVLGTARLVAPNGIDSVDSIRIEPGASIEAYVGGTSVSVSGNTILNKGGAAENFILYCADSVKNVSITGNGEFIGVIVAPEAHMSLNGGGNNTVDVIGALLVKSITMNGHFNMHYDECLLNKVPTGRYLIFAWEELY